MAEQPEARLQRKIVEALNLLPNCYVEKIHGSQFGKQKLDLMGAKEGKMFLLEVKTPGNTPTKKQLATMRLWQEKAGVYTEWVDSVEKAVSLISGLN